MFTESLIRIRHRISILHGSISLALRKSQLQRHYYDHPHFTAGKTEAQWPSCGLQWACPRPRREREGCLGPKFQVCLASEPLLIKITVDDMWPVAQSCQTLCYSMDCSLPGSYVRGIPQARILEWVAISSARGSSPPRDQTWVSCISSIGSGFFTMEPPGNPYSGW